MNAFKMSVFWSAWTPQVQSRLVRDVLSVQRIARVNRTPLMVACDRVAHSILNAVGIITSDDHTEPTVCYVYLVSGQDIPDEISERLPEGVEVRTYSLYGSGEALPPLQIDDDPYAGVKFYDDTTRIDETMPLDKRPPKVDWGAEPMYSPFLTRR